MCMLLRFAAFHSQIQILFCPNPVACSQLVLIRTMYVSSHAISHFHYLSAFYFIGLERIGLCLDRWDRDWNNGTDIPVLHLPLRVRGSLLWNQRGSHFLYAFITFFIPIVLVVDINTDDVTISGDIEGGIACIEWSPDQEVWPLAHSLNFHSIVPFWATTEAFCWWTACAKSFTNRRSRTWALSRTYFALLFFSS